MEVVRIWVLLLPVLALLLAAPPAARADLAVLTGERILKVVDYRVLGDTVRLQLPSGGVLTLPLSRIERIVEDEVVPEPEPLPEPEFGHLFAFDETEAVPSTPFGALIHDAARRHQLHPRLVAAVVRAESAFDPYAISRKGARGLMQLMPATARRFGVPEEELFDPQRNLEAGSRYLRWLAERFAGDLPRILAAYNAGEATVDRYDGVPPFRETLSYIRRIYSTLGLTGADPGATP